MPRIDAVLSELAGSRIFSTLDASSAYHCIPVEPASRPLTAFITPYGLYEFARMPFGLKNSGATYCRMVQKMMDRIGEEGLVA